ncbi:unnamed protein product [Clonostachys rosea]|uniref:Transmembrane protein n=1 Tax=Bionectria ochroleuca TaxID=29856 RepID=A0ABY6UHI1_BIOOC|nr:unnamed protein product [Clonostachys rosea]
MILPPLSSWTITGSIKPRSYHPTGTTTAASVHSRPGAVTPPTTHPYNPSRSVDTKNESAGHSDDTHRSSTGWVAGRLGLRAPTSQHDGDSDKTALIIMGVFLGVGLLLSLMFWCVYAAAAAPKAVEDAEASLELPGLRARMAPRDLKDEKDLAGHKETEANGESGENKDPKEIQA